MSVNTDTVDRYMEAFQRTDHAAILACLTEDVEWEIPGFRQLKGKAAFDTEIENDAFTGRPAITVHRHVEQLDVVVSEGTVRATKRDGSSLLLRFCDVFEMRGGLIARLTSYLVVIG